ncbi:MAG: HlyD family secretion protein [Anaerolineales bacterium]|jgi:multidrug efflux pump subunit AcrA (membrane-fusion protein)
MKKHVWKFIFIILSLVFTAACSEIESTEPAEQDISVPEVRFAPIISATGVVVPVDWSQLSMTAPGIVEQILISEDEVVTPGQVLVRLEGKEQLEAALSAAELELADAQHALNDLNENTALLAAQALLELESSREALEDLLDSDMQEASALQAIAEAEKTVDSAERRLRILESTADQADIDAAKAQVILAENALDKANDDFEPYANKREDNLIRANLLAHQAMAQQVYDAAVRKLNALMGSGSELDVAVAKADLATAQAHLADARRTWERVKTGPRQGDIEFLEAKIDLAQDEYDIYQNGPDPDDLQVAEARLANAQAQWEAAEAALSDLELRAPFEGNIAEIFVHSSEWVNIGQPVLLLADIDHLQIETTDLSEIDLTQLRLGDNAIVTFDAFPDLVVEGTVKRIAPKAAGGTGVNYPIIIELKEIPDQLRWGMTAFVDIEVEG